MSSAWGRSKEDGDKTVPRVPWALKPSGKGARTCSAPAEESEKRVGERRGGIFGCPYEVEVGCWRTHRSHGV